MRAGRSGGRDCTHAAVLPPSACFIQRQPWRHPPSNQAPEPRLAAPACERCQPAVPGRAFPRQDSPTPRRAPLTRGGWSAPPAGSPRPRSRRWRCRWRRSAPCRPGCWWARAWALCALCSSPTPPAQRCSAARRSGNTRAAGAREREGVPFAGCFTIRRKREEEENSGWLAAGGGGGDRGGGRTGGIQVQRGGHLPPSMAPAAYTVYLQVPSRPADRQQLHAAQLAAIG